VINPTLPWHLRSWDGLRPGFTAQAILNAFFARGWRSSISPDSAFLHPQVRVYGNLVCWKCDEPGQALPRHAGPAGPAPSGEPQEGRTAACLASQTVPR
jgi:hypothetical protein